MDSERQDRLDIEAIIYDKRPDLVQTYLDDVKAARKVANPDLDLAHRFDVMRIGGPTADGRVHLNGSLSNDEWGRLQAALGFTEDTE